jgi:hypothetical protein
MSSLGDAIGRRRHARGAERRPLPTPAPGAQAPPAQAPPAGTPQAGAPPAGALSAGAAGAERTQLRNRRDELAEQVTVLHWDLGGLAYEMAIRDHFRLDVLVRRAAILQERDAELAEVERLLALEESASAGSCPICAAPHSRGAVFCWQCGATLMERAPSSAMPALGLPGVGEQREASTVAMDALLAPEAGSIADGAANSGTDPTGSRGELPPEG